MFVNRNEITVNIGPAWLFSSANYTNDTVINNQGNIYGFIFIDEHVYQFLSF